MSIQSAIRRVWDRCTVSPPISPTATLVAAFGQFTPQMQRNLDDYRIVTFIEARAKETSPVTVDWCKSTIDVCCERIDASGPDLKPFWLRGAVKDMEPLKAEARTWADHPDFRPEWAA